MELTVYRQAQKTRPDGTIVYRGEDALPYVDDHLLVVADGMGGAAAIRHTRFVSELFDRETIADSLLRDIPLYEGEDRPNEAYVKYLQDAFFELYAVKDCYMASPANMKKSGYFASRLVAAIILRECKCNPEMKPEAFFEDFDEAAEEGALEEFLEDSGHYFAMIIKQELQRIAKSANLIYETAFSGLALLGTTLCAAIFREKEGHVDVVYLTAGDSRPYVWSKKDGLCQLLEDEEGKDGGMTNYIRANENADFHIRCNAFRLEKPCMIFNASDGCFDSSAFLSPMAFEKLLLDCIVQSSGEAEMSEKLCQFFAENGRHDDSSTIAMKMFGYDSWAALQQEAQSRLDVLQKQYLDRMPELLDKDFSAEDQKESSLAEKVAEQLKSLGKEPVVLQHCVRAVLEGKEPSYTSAMAQEKLDLEEAEKQLSVLRSRIGKEIREHTDAFWPLLQKLPAEMKRRIDSTEMERVRKQSREQSDLCAKLIQDMMPEFDKAMEAMNRLRSFLADTGAPQTEEGLEAFRKLSAGLSGSMESVNSACRRVKREGASAVSMNRAMIRKTAFLSEDDQLTESIVDQILEDDAALSDDGSISPGIRDELARVIGEARALRDKIKSLKGPEHKHELIEQARALYWDAHYASVIEHLSKLPAEEGGLGQELRSKVNAILHVPEDQEEEQDFGALQKELLEEYEKGYRQYMKKAEETTRQDKAEESGTV